MQYLGDVACLFRIDGYQFLGCNERKGCMKIDGVEKPALLLAGGQRSSVGEMAKSISRAFTEGQKTTLAYIGAASGDSYIFFNMMKALLKKAGADKVTFVRLAKEKVDLENIKNTLSSADVVFISGGEVEDGMKWLNKHLLVDFIKDLYRGGKQFIGVSAGSIMLGSSWVKWDDPDNDDTAALFDCIGIIPAVFDTHAEDENWKELKTVLRLMGDGARGYGLTRGCAIYADSHGNLENLEKTVLTYANYNGQIQLAEE